MGSENIMRDGDFVLCDYDCADGDADKAKHLYCIAYIKGEEEHEVMLIWKRGRVIRSRSIGSSLAAYRCNAANVVSFSRLLSAAQDLLDGK